MIRLSEMLMTGRPFTQVVYRGDDIPFTEFDPKMIGRKGYDTVGFWFSDSEDAAAYFGENVRPFEITMKDPYVISGEEFAKLFPSGPGKLARKAKSLGYDGLVLIDVKDGDRWSTVFCVFSPEQIRPVTHTSPA